MDQVIDDVLAYMINPEDRDDDITLVEVRIMVRLQLVLQAQQLTLLRLDQERVSGRIKLL